MAYLISTILFVVLVVFGMGDYAFAFVDIPSLLLILPAFLFAVAATTGCFFYLVWRMVFGIKSEPDDRALRGALAYLESLGNLALWMGAVGLLIGTILMLHHLNDPAQIGPALAMAILTVFYGLLVKLLCATAGKRLEHLLAPRT